MSKTIGIMGCGWLGKPLAIKLLDSGYKVKGTTTSISKLEELRQAGIDPYIVDLQETYIDGGVQAFLEDLEVLVVNIPTGLRSNPQSDYAGRIQLLVNTVNNHANIQQLIYVSSTSVFEDGKDIPTYNESDAPNATDQKGKKLIAAEQVIQNAKASSTIIRPGGLIGGDRHPIQMLSGRKNVSSPDAPVNLTDRDYLIEVIERVIYVSIQSSIVHAISEPHENRKLYYTRTSAAFELEAPSFSDEESVGKKIVSTIL